MKIVLLTSDVCPPCEVAKRTLKPWVDSGDIEIVRGESDAGSDLIDKVVDKGIGLSSPMLLVVDQENQIFGQLSVSDTEEVEAEEKRLAQSV